MDEVLILIFPVVTAVRRSIDTRPLAYADAVLMNRVRLYTEY